MFGLLKTEGGGGRNFSKKSEIQKSLNYLRGGGGLFGNLFIPLDFHKYFKMEEFAINFNM